jgi:hypothetical protein
LLILPLVLRSGVAFSKARQSFINIYEQQYQMSQFSHLYYNNKVIAANDIGALSFFNQAHILDLWGLASNDVARSRKQNYWTPAFLDSLTKREHSSIAIVYDSWFPAPLLNRWNKVATWTIPNNVVCGDSTVSFYAIDTSGRQPLRTHLKAFEPSLPKEVRVRYY